jgi:hypothetical protein
VADMKVMKGKMLKSVPMEFLEPHRQQAERNHYQTLERLNERGGLTAREMLAVIYDVEFRRINPGIDHEEHLQRKLEIWERKRAAHQSKGENP